MEKYNGWTNYATWRINLEMFDGYETEEKVDADYCKYMAEEYLDMDCDNNLTKDYANAFIHNVNWYEIAEAVNEYNGNMIGATWEK
jgi:hypothetical protein